ncbi:AAA family ATPase [Sphingomonas sp.]|uniref:AAA family ATPase n=1 Tax=Sphingomonas sp. TaxID=28214 RepID=UPI001B06E251|nr:AAA family ATPase [Sphingomonas sp.]MBO9712512.1 AAA family ATPase [Sphingomonas sp.]
MNDETPRRLKGSLLERAAEQFHYMPAPKLPEAPAPVAAPAPAAASSARHPGESRDPGQQAVSPVALGPGFRRDDEEVGAIAPEPVEPLTLHEPIGRRRAAIDREKLAAAGMIVPGASVTPLAEEFRMVKRQLILTAQKVAGADQQRARMVLVCSAQPDEGKTFCAINLALSMAAETDVEILLVDADFAKPDVLARLGIAEGPGLLDVLSGAVADAEDCIIDTDVPQLSLLPAGTRTHMDTELLASARARAILDRLAAANPRRIVIFDSPPALAASPASVLALIAGQVMLVVRADRTSESDVREAVQMLDACEHIQLVLNSVSYQPGGRRFGSYYGYGETAK